MGYLDSLILTIHFLGNLIPVFTGSNIYISNNTKYDFKVEEEQYGYKELQIYKEYKIYDCGIKTW